MRRGHMPIECKRYCASGCIRGSLAAGIALQARKLPTITAGCALGVSCQLDTCPAHVASAAPAMLDFITAPSHFVQRTDWEHPVARAYVLPVGYVYCMPLHHADGALSAPSCTFGAKLHCQRQVALSAPSCPRFASNEFARNRTSVTRRQLACQ